MFQLLKLSLFTLLFAFVGSQAALGATESGDVGSYTFNRNLALGSRGQDVKELQKFLNENGFIVSVEGDGSKGNETEYFGNRTRSALKTYQEFYREEILRPLNLIYGTGELYDKTRAFINEYLKNNPVGETVTKDNDVDSTLGSIIKGIKRIGSNYINVLNSTTTDPEITFNPLFRRVGDVFKLTPESESDGKMVFDTSDDWIVRIQDDVATVLRRTGPEGVTIKMSQVESGDWNAVSTSTKLYATELLCDSSACSYNGKCVVNNLSCTDTSDSPNMCDTNVFKCECDPCFVGDTCSEYDYSACH